MLQRAVATGLLMAALSCGAIAFPAPAIARTVVGVSIGVAPPPVRVEHVHVRAGYVLAPGYWRWNGRRHVWVGGRAIVARPGYRYVGAGWVHAGPHWHFRRGGWVRR